MATVMDLFALHACRTEAETRHGCKLDSGHETPKSNGLCLCLMNHDRHIANILSGWIDVRAAGQADKTGAECSAADRSIVSSDNFYGPDD